MSHNYRARFTIVGDSKVGKTSLAKRFSLNEFTSKYESTVGIQFHCQQIQLANNFKKKTAKMQIWDTAGSKSFQYMNKVYYKIANIVFIVFDVTNTHSFKNTYEWFTLIRKENNTCVIALIGNKTDLNSNRVISAHSARTFANKHNMIYLETSAKESLESVKRAFQATLVRAIISPKSGVSINDSNDDVSYGRPRCSSFELDVKVRRRSQICCCSIM